jgi:DivIVA domain-containing protein
MLTPRQIEETRFTSTRVKAGYDQGEVDDFLERVQSDYETLYHSTAATEVLPVVKAAPVAPEQPSEMIAKILTVAEETAAKHIAEAHSEAVRIVAKANADAKDITDGAEFGATELVAAARGEVETLRHEAESERHRAIGELEDKRAKLKEKVDELIRVETEVTTRLRNALERWNV